MRQIEKSVCLEEFGEYLKKERLRRGMNQTEVAKLAGIHQTYYGKIEHGKRAIDLVGAMKICNALGLDLSDFVKRFM